MGDSIKKLKEIPCPICGEMPYEDSDKRFGVKSREYSEYKVHCPNHHLDCCNWAKTRLEAWQLWKKRTTDVTQPDFCFNDNHFTVTKMTVDDMAAFLLKWHKNASEIMCTNGEITVESIKKWLEKPVNGLYPKGYPGIPKEQQSQDEDIYRYRKMQAKCKIV